MCRGHANRGENANGFDSRFCTGAQKEMEVVEGRGGEKLAQVDVGTRTEPGDRKLGISILVDLKRMKGSCSL